MARCPVATNWTVQAGGECGWENRGFPGIYVEEVSESSKQIGNVVEVIRELADQTNLLALIATIEEQSTTMTGLSQTAESLVTLSKRNG